MDDEIQTSLGKATRLDTKCEAKLVRKMKKDGASWKKNLNIWMFWSLILNTHLLARFCFETFPLQLCGTCMMIFFFLKLWKQEVTQGQKQEIDDHVHLAYCDDADDKWHDFLHYLILR